jgi:hypothetical protein
MKKRIEFFLLLAVLSKTACAIEFSKVDIDTTLRMTLPSENQIANQSISPTDLILNIQYGGNYEWSVQSGFTGIEPGFPFGWEAVPGFRDLYYDAGELYALANPPEGFVLIETLSPGSSVSALIRNLSDEQVGINLSYSVDYDLEVENPNGGTAIAKGKSIVYAEDNNSGFVYLNKVLFEGSISGTDELSGAIANQSLPALVLPGVTEINPIVEARIYLLHEYYLEVEVVPEPSTLLLFTMGIIFLRSKSKNK